MKKTSFLRRAALALTGALLATPVLAQPAEVKLAVVVALSGPSARNGELHLKGAQLAADQTNAAGGLKALGGAKIKLIVGDAGDSTERAKNAMQRILSSNPDLTGGTGKQATDALPVLMEVAKAAGVAVPKTAGIVMDNTASPVSLTKPMRAMDSMDGAAKFFPSMSDGGLKFDAAGRRSDASLVVLQWQGGEPRPVDPVTLANATAAWPKR